MAGASRPTKAVLQPVATKAPFKKPAGKKALPPGGPQLPQGLPGVPGDPTMGSGSTGSPPSGVRGFVDANSLHTVTHYSIGEGTDQSDAESPLYGSGPGLGPQTDIRPPTEGAPPRQPKVGGKAVVAGTASTPGKYAR